MITVLGCHSNEQNKIVIPYFEIALTPHSRPSVNSIFFLTIIRNELL